MIHALFDGFEYSSGMLRTIELSGDQMIPRGSLTVTNAQGRLWVGNGVAYVLMQPAFRLGFPEGRAATAPSTS